MTLNTSTILFVCTLTFLAGLIDSIAGGGGLISLPAYISAGVPLHLAVATNKLSSASGTFFAFIRFVKNGQIHWRSASFSALAAFPGSYLGARLILVIDELYLKYLLLFILPIIAILVLRSKRFGETDSSDKLSKTQIIVISIMMGFIIGAYDGFFGPGTGTFLILAYTGLIGFNLATASGNTKVVNLTSNVSALITFIVMDKVVYAIGIPAALTGILGNWIGAGLAVKKGAKITRPVFISVVVLLFLKLLYDLF
jgi:uncharacterized membrane protein YfcA